MHPVSAGGASAVHQQQQAQRQQVVQLLQQQRQQQQIASQAGPQASLTLMHWTALSALQPNPIPYEGGSPSLHAVEAVTALCGNFILIRGMFASLEAVGGVISLSNTTTRYMCRCVGRRTGRRSILELCTVLT